MANLVNIRYCRKFVKYVTSAYPRSL